jgi:hypothetical protein
LNGLSGDASGSGDVDGASDTWETPRNNDAGSFAVFEELQAGAGRIEYAPKDLSVRGRVAQRVGGRARAKLPPQGASSV